MQNRSIILVLVIGILSALGASAWYGQSGHEPQHAPEVTFSIIDGSKIDLGELQGQPVLVQFWATTCRVCRHEIPELIALYRDLHPRGLAMVAVAMPYDPPNRVLDLARKTPLPYPVALDIDGAATGAFGNVRLTPTTFLIAPDGRIVLHSSGRLDFGKFRQRIEKMLAGEPQVTANRPKAMHAHTGV